MDAERIQKRERRKTKAALKGQCVAILLSVPGIEATEEEEKLGFPLVEQLNELLISG